MVHKCTLFDNNNEKLLSFNRVDLDICRSMTIIVKKHETINLPLAVSSILIKHGRITVLYDNDYSLTIQHNTGV